MAALHQSATHVTGELREEERAQDSRAQTLGYWMIGHQAELSKVFTRLCDVLDSGEALSQQETHEVVRWINAVAHEVNRQTTVHRYHARRISSLHQTLKRLLASEKDG